MIQLGSILKVTDKSGIVLVQCIKVLGHYKKKIAFLGDVIIVSVQWLDALRISRLKQRLQKKFIMGSLHRALIVRTKVNYCRSTGIYIKFDENSVVLVTKNVVPLTNRVFGPILRESCMRWPSLGCVTSCII